MTTTPSHRSRAYLALGLGLMGLAFSGIFVKWANAPGTVTGFYRMAGAILVLAPMFWHRWRTLERVPRREVQIAVLAGLFFATDLTLWNTGILLSGATNPTLLGNTAPLWVGVGAVLFFREKLTRPFWIGLLLAISGAALILGLDALSQVGLGTFLGLLAGIFYGAYYLVTQRSRQRLDALTAFWLSAASSTVWLLLASLLFRQPLTGYPASTYWNFLGLALIVQVGGQMAISYALGYLPASVVSPTMLGQPILTALLAMPLLGERLQFWQVIGGLVVITGVYLVHRSHTPGI